MSDRVFDAIAVFCLVLGSILLAGGILTIHESIHGIILIILACVFYGITYVYFYGVYRL